MQEATLLQSIVKNLHIINPPGTKLAKSEVQGRVREEIQSK